jgi:hypothetical protein
MTSLAGEHGKFDHSPPKRRERRPLLWAVVDWTGAVLA